MRETTSLKTLIIAAALGAAAVFVGQALIGGAGWHTPAMAQDSPAVAAAPARAVVSQPS